MILDTLLKEFSSKLGIDYTDIDNNDLYTLTELKRWMNFGKDEAVARHPWPFTEGRREIASVSGQERYDYPSSMKSDSIRYMTVNDKRYGKLLFEDYLQYRENRSSGTQKLFSDRSREI